MLERNSNPNGGGDILEPIKVKNAQTYARVKTCLYNNLEKICQTQDNRMRTKKIYSQEVNHDIIEILNIVIQTEKLDEHINSLKELNDLLYVCQVTYEKVTVKEKKDSNWKESIEKKIAKFDQHLKTIDNHDQQKRPSNEMIQLCKNNQIRSSKESDIQKLKDRLEEKIAVYKKKISIANKRTQFRKENKAFEFNRKMFYRTLDENNNKVDENINKEQVKQFWTSMWSKEEEPEDYKETTNLLEPGKLQSEATEEKIRIIVENRLKYMPNWKTPGPDQVYNFFIKKIFALHGKLTQLVKEAIEDANLVDDDMYIGNTYLIPKVKVAKEAKELRPITCLPNLYKLLSRVVSTLVNEFCEINNIISKNQMGTRKGCQTAGIDKQSIKSEI